jgi:hypothetical protein
VNFHIANGVAVDGESFRGLGELQLAGKAIFPGVRPGGTPEQGVCFGGDIRRMTRHVSKRGRHSAVRVAKVMAGANARGIEFVSQQKFLQLIRRDPIPDQTRECNGELLDGVISLQ